MTVRLSDKIMYVVYSLDKVVRCFKDRIVIEFRFTFFFSYIIVSKNYLPLLPLTSLCRTLTLKKNELSIFVLNKLNVSNNHLNFFLIMLS